MSAAPPSEIQVVTVATWSEGSFQDGLPSRATLQKGAMDRVPPLRDEPALRNLDSFYQSLQARPNPAVEAWPLDGSSWFVQPAGDAIPALRQRVASGTPFTITNIEQIIPAAADVLSALVQSLPVPVERYACNARLLSAGANVTFRAETDLFLIVVAGAPMIHLPCAGSPARDVQRDRPDAQPGTTAFVPRGTEVNLRSLDVSLTLEFTLRIASASDQTVALEEPHTSVLSAPVQVRRLSSMALIENGSLTQVRIVDDGLETLIDVDENRAALVRWVLAQPRPFNGHALMRATEADASEAARALRWLSMVGVLEDAPEAAARDRYSEFQPRSSDIWIATYPKSGTTWMQMLVYLLTGSGRVDFDHIYEKSPYFEVEYALHGARRIESLPSPRLLKTHLPHREMPTRQGRFIYIVRDVLDVAVSLFFHRQDFDNYRGDLAMHFDEFARGILPCGSWFGHVAGWWQKRNDTSLLFLRYEDLHSDFHGTAQKVCRFLGLDSERFSWPEIRRLASFEAMKAHEEKFDHENGMHWLNQYSKRSGFLRKGVVGGWRQHLQSHDLQRLKRTYQLTLAGSGLIPDME